MKREGEGELRERWCVRVVFEGLSERWLLRLEVERLGGLLWKGGRFCPRSWEAEEMEKETEEELGLERFGLGLGFEEERELGR